MPPEMYSSLPVRSGCFQACSRGRLPGLQQREINRRLFANDCELKRTARTLPSLNPRPESREARPPMRACAVDREAGHVKRGGRKPNEDCRDGYQKLECAVSFCSQDRLALVVRRWRRFSFDLSPLNREVANCRSETAESISNTFERSAAQLLVTCDRDQTVSCSCVNDMAVP